ncbi:MAG: hypothetical protein AAFO58_05795 [Pseudomonadota bacterium]
MAMSTPVDRDWLRVVTVISDQDRDPGIYNYAEMPPVRLKVKCITEIAGKPVAICEQRGLEHYLVLDVDRITHHPYVIDRITTWEYDEIVRDGSRIFAAPAVQKRAI